MKRPNRRATRRRSDGAPPRRPYVVAFADIAELAGVNRSTVGRAFRPGGPLYPALVGPGRGDRGHPCVVRWLTEHGVGSAAPRELSTQPAKPLLDYPRSLISEREAADRAGVSVKQLRREMEGALAPAVVPPHHLPARLFAVIAGATPKAVLEAARKPELAPAVTSSGLIDLGHETALAYLAARPFRRLSDGDVDQDDVPEGMLAPACVGEKIDFASPWGRAFVARCLGRIPNAVDLAEAAQ